ncbi:MAG: dTDP-4-dehydrorhamnose 3,5-epimerase family protein [Nitriliruptoraceae bacterium]|nr:dTDP-4-dehydrorhamnose 3,5-epimerase family protein [Nitriliruptoraceae bacterium]
MAVERTAIEGLLVVRWDTHGDERGFFRQTYQRSELAAVLGREPVFAQGNHSRSAAGVLRGFHAEPWDKFVYVARGTAFCAVVDLRVDSPTVGEVATFRLGDAPGERVRLFLSEGLGNAFLALSEVDYLYDVGAEYRPGVDKRAVAWDDPELGVDWPVESPIVSDADRANPSFAEVVRGG